MSPGLYLNCTSALVLCLPPPSLVLLLLRFGKVDRRTLSVLMRLGILDSGRYDPVDGRDGLDTLDPDVIELVLVKLDARGMLDNCLDIPFDGGLAIVK